MEKGSKHSKETKKKMSLSAKGKHFYWQDKKLSKKHRKKLSEAKKGFNHPNWKGGERTNYQGYVLVHKPNHPFCNSQGYVRRSRLVMEKHLGRYLKPKEQVHHINGIRDDDRFENLKLFATNSEHIKFEHNKPIIS